MAFIKMVKLFKLFDDIYHLDDRFITYVSSSNCRNQVNRLNLTLDEIHYLNDHLDNFAINRLKFINHLGKAFIYHAIMHLQ